jgi:hypothetical protein
MSLFKKKKIEAPRDPDTYGEGLLIVTCKKYELTLIKEHFNDEIRYIVKDGDRHVYNGTFWERRWALDSANSARHAIYEWARKNRIGVTSEVLVP